MNQREFVERHTLPGATHGEGVTVVSGRSFVSATELERAGWRIVRDVYPWMAYKDGAAEMILTDREHALYMAICADSEVALEKWKLNRTKVDDWRTFDKRLKDVAARRHRTLNAVKERALALLAGPLDDIRPHSNASHPTGHGASPGAAEIPRVPKGATGKASRASR